MKISDATDSTIAELRGRLEASATSASVLEDAAQETVNALREHFADSVTLARAFVTVPFSELPSSNQQFVRNLASDAPELGPATPVLSLVGSSGSQANWCDRRKSEGHVGIPLVSSSFVGAIPMISRLLKELGIPLNRVDTWDSDIIIKTIGRSAGVFYVSDAANSVDQEGRKVIAAQDFVAEHSIKSVFGFGGAYLDGKILVIVLFCQEFVDRSSAEQLSTLVDQFKVRTDALAQSGAIFSD
jgi:hypothetical protein